MGCTRHVYYHSTCIVQTLSSVANSWVSIFYNNTNHSAYRVATTFPQLAERLVHLSQASIWVFVGDKLCCLDGGRISSSFIFFGIFNGALLVSSFGYFGVINPLIARVFNLSELSTVVFSLPFFQRFCPRLRTFRNHCQTRISAPASSLLRTPSLGVGNALLIPLLGV